MSCDIGKRGVAQQSYKLRNLDLISSPVIFTSTEPRRHSPRGNTRLFQGLVGRKLTIGLADHCDI
jgi:hypothetical protein